MGEHGTRVPLRPDDERKRPALGARVHFHGLVYESSHAGSMVVLQYIPSFYAVAPRVLRSVPGRLFSSQQSRLAGRLAGQER